MRWLVFCVLGAGCSTLLGLHGAKDDDLDGDHVPDDVDNCKTVPNPDQSDFDHNGIGDACDGCASPDPTDSDHDGIPDACDGCDNNKPDNNHDGVPDECETLGGGDGGFDPCPGCSACAVGPRHDEDGDLIPDGCDLCPSIISGAEDADQDGVGDHCDIDPVKSFQIFDAFLVANPDWISRGPWVTSGDRATLALASGNGYASLGAVSGVFIIRSRITASSPNIMPIAKPAIYAGNNQNPALATELIACELGIGNFSQPTLTASVVSKGGNMSAPVALPNDGPWTVALQVSKVGFGCTASSDPGMGAIVIGTPLMAVTIPTSYPTGIAGTGGGTASFDYFDLVADPP